MNQSDNKFLLNAISIADDLLNKTIKTETGWTWETLSWSEEAGTSWHTLESIYNGISGIAVFFIELYKQTNDERYKEAAINGMAWVEHNCKNNPTDYYAFFTGRMGVAYTMLQMYKLTGEESYNKQALSVITACEDFLNSPHPVDDLINGTSGCLLGLLHLHAATGNEALLLKINQFVAHLISSTETGPQGLYWDRDSKSIRGLCGFSHGASGIGFVFLELAHYFQNPAFYWIAEQSFQYENQFYSDQYHNWPDFRKGIYSIKDYEQHKEAYSKQDLNFFTQPGHMAAWCHGAPGIGLSRLRASELLHDVTYKNDLRNAIETTRNSAKQSANGPVSYTLCHGGGGNAMLFIDAYRQTENEEYLAAARLVATEAIHSKAQYGMYHSGFGMAKDTEDTSLFMGNAGVGYYYLQCHDPLNVPSILAPTINSQFKGNLPLTCNSIAISKAELKKQVLRKNFLRTIALLEKEEPIKLSEFLTQELSNKENLATAFRVFMQSIHGEQIQDVFALENEKSLMNEAIASNALLYIEQDVLRNAAKETIEKENLPALRLKKDIKIVTTRWNWDLTKNMNEESDEYGVLLLPTPEGIVEKSLSTFTYIVLNSFEEATQTEAAIADALDVFEAETPEEKETLKALVSKQIQEGLLSGILITVN